VVAGKWVVLAAGIVVGAADIRGTETVPGA